MEIERKFLIPKLPENLDTYDSYEIEQVYLCTKPTVRIRKGGEKYTLTYKGAGQLAHEEYNLPLTAESYAHLFEKHDGKVIHKRRYLIPLPPYTIELDTFFEPRKFWMAEVEFPTEEEALAFVPPSWFGQDVTYDGRYSNAWMALHE